MNTLSQKLKANMEKWVTFFGELYYKDGILTPKIQEENLRMAIEFCQLSLLSEIKTWAEGKICHSYDDEQTGFNRAVSNLLSFFIVRVVMVFLLGLQYTLRSDRVAPLFR